jgi:hypothetical protein
MTDALKETRMKIRFVLFAATFSLCSQIHAEDFSSIVLSDSHASINPTYQPFVADGSAVAELSIGDGGVICGPAKFTIASETVFDLAAGKCRGGNKADFEAGKSIEFDRSELKP